LRHLRQVHAHDGLELVRIFHGGTVGRVGPLIRSGEFGGIVAHIVLGNIMNANVKALLGIARRALHGWVQRFFAPRRVAARQRRIRQGSLFRFGQGKQ
jgi:hypothetical protein